MSVARKVHGFLIAAFCLLAAASSHAAVVHQETLTVAGSATSSLNIGGVQGGTDQLYVTAAAIYETGVNVSSISGGGLTWTQQVTQCAARLTEPRIEIWQAFGSPGAAFSTVVTLSAAAQRATAAISRYSGADPTTPTEGAAGSNTNGPSGACTGGIDNANLSLSLTSTLNDSVLYVASHPRNQTLTVEDAAYAQRAFVSNSGGTDGANLYVHDRTLATAGIDSADHTASSATDWDMAGVVIRPAAPVGTSIYYSVGTDNTTLHSDTASAATGTLTLTNPAPNDVGVGDEVQEGANRYYITGRTSSTVFTIQDSAANGGTPGDSNISFGLTTISIFRAFNSLTAAVAGSSNANHLNTPDLVTGNFQLNWTCYNDAPLNDIVQISGYATGPNNYIHIYTPTGANEVGVSQRHTGTAGTGFRLAPISSAPIVVRIIEILDDDVRITGVEIDGSSVTNGMTVEGIEVDTSVSLSSDIRFSKLMIHDLRSQNGSGGDADVNGLDIDNGNVKLSNSILYDLEQTTANPVADVFAVNVTSASAGSNIYVHNNTIFNIKNTGNDRDARGIFRSVGNVTVRSTAVLDVAVTGLGSAACFVGTITQSNNVSSDGTAVGATNQSAYASYFVDTTAGFEDLHLLSDSFSLWTLFGADLDSDPNLPITDDIDGEARDPFSPDIGADEFVPAPPDLTQAHYRWRNDDGGEGIAVVEVRVSQSDDDAEEDTGTSAVSVVNADLELVEDGAAFQEVGLRFQNITVPPSATITSAYIQFGADQSSSVLTNLTFQGEDIDNAPVFTTGLGDITTRIKTGASVAWTSVPAWTLVGEAGPNQRTPDLSPIIQQIVNRGGWANGNSLAIIVTGSGTRIAESYDDNPSAAPLLHIEYATGAAATFPLAEDTKLVGLSKNTIRRVRLEVSNEGGPAPGPVSLELQVAETATCAAGTYTSVPIGSGGHWQIIDSSFITDGEPTANISPGLTDEALNFVAGELKDTSNATGSLLLDGAEFTEVEFSIQATANATGGGDYCFRLYDDINNQVLDTYTVYAEAQLAGDDIFVGASGTQTVVMPIPSTDQYVGGKFVITDNTGSHNITDITIAESGTVDALNNLSNIKLFYELDTTAPFDGPSQSYTGTEAQFGVTDTDGFSAANGTSSFTGSVAISTLASMVVYVVFDVGPAAVDGETVEIGIGDPSTDVVATSASVGPATSVEISGTTTLSTPDLTQIHYRWRNDDGGEPTGGGAIQAGATADTMTTSGTDVVVSGMTLTPGPGDYLVWFSGSVESTAASTQHVSLYLDGARVGHTEREITTDSSVPNTSFLVALHARLTGVTAGQTIDIRWRTDAGTATMHERTLVVEPVNVADTSQAAVVLDTATTSGADVPVSGMSITPGAGDYLVWFSGSVESDTASTRQFVSIYQNGTQIADSEREIFTEASIPDTSFSVATHARILGLGAGESIDIRWRTTGGTATMHERTLVVQKINPVDVFQATATGDDTTSATSDVLVPGMTLTPGAGQYLVWFSGSMEGDLVNTTQYVSIYVNGVQLPHTPRQIFTEDSIAATSFPIATHAYVIGVGASDTIDVRWRTTGGNATMHQRTLVVQNLGSGSGATFAAAEDTRLTGLAKNTIKRVRLEVSNEGGGGSGAVNYELQVAETTVCSGGTYTTVPTGSADHWQVIDSTFVTDGQPTSDISPGLTNEATTFVAGELKDLGNTTGGITLAPDEFSEIEFSVQATTNATDGGDYCFRLYDATNSQVLDTYTVFAQVQLAVAGGASLTLADHGTGQIGDRFTTTTPVTDVLFRFNLSRTGPVTVANIRVNFTTGGGVVSGDVSSGELYRDANNDGVIDGGDILVQGGVSPTGGVLAFNSLSEDPTVGTNYLVRATVANLAVGDTTTFYLGLSDIDVVESGVVESGSTSDATHTQDPVTGGDVFYSVGTETADLKTGTPSITIANGTATLTSAQTGNIGVGDEIDYDIGNTKAYIKSVISQTEFVVHTATGAAPINVNGLGVNAIRRAFNTLFDAEANSGDAAHLTTFDLTGTGAGANLTWVCYNDSFPFNMATQVVVDGYITDATHTLTLTVASASDVASGVSQRHVGIAGTGARVIATGSNGPLLIVSDDYTTVEWLEIDGDRDSSLDRGYGIRIDGPVTDVTLRQLIVHDVEGTTGFARGIGIRQANPVYVYNNFVYDIVSSNDAGTVYGIVDENVGAFNTFIYNNTLYNVRNSQATSSTNVYGIVVPDTSERNVRNNIVIGVTTAGSGFFQDYCAYTGILGAETCHTPPTPPANATFQFNMSSDASALDNPPGTTSITGENALEFKNAADGFEDLHLAATANAINAGTDLTPTFPNDVDDQARLGFWDMGADEVVATENLRSIGDAPDYVAGTITATDGSSVVTGTGTNWQTANRGRGDRIDINNMDYTILSVDSETQLTLTTPVAGNFSGTYTISRQFGTLPQWETCISGGGGCVYFPVASGNLVAEGRKEIGIMYADSPFNAPVIIDGSITDPVHSITLTADGPNRHYGIPGRGVVFDNTFNLVDAIGVRDDFVTVEWLEIFGGGDPNADGIHVRNQAIFNYVVVRNLLVHDMPRAGITTNDADAVTDIYNNIIYNAGRGIRVDNTLAATAQVRILNNTVHNSSGTGGITSLGGSAVVLLQNNIAHTTAGGNDFDVPNLDPSSSDNLASDPSGILHSPSGGGINVPLVAVSFVNAPAGNLHINPGSAAEGVAFNLSAIFTVDIDDGLRSSWDIGADEVAAIPQELTQVRYRWRNDDGNEVAATWAAPENTKLTGVTKGPIRRLRFQVANGGGTSSGPLTYQLQVAETASCSLGAYSPVPTDNSGHWRVDGSSFVTDGEPTTNVAPGLTDAASTFVTGEVKDAGNTTGGINLDSDEFTEIEFAINATANATDLGDYCFRLYDANGGAPLPVYSVYAAASVAGPASLILADHDLGQIPDQFSTTTPVTTELFGFKLTRSGTVTVDGVQVHFSTGSGVVDGDVTAGELWRDENNNGVIDGGTDTLLQGAVTPSGGVLDFGAILEDPGVTGTNYLVGVTVANLVPGDTTTFSMGIGDLDDVEVGVNRSGSVPDAVHTQDSVMGGDVFYSVGTDTSDFLTASDISITNGTATFTVPQTGDIGVGDEIDFGGPKVYIKTVLSPTQFVVHAANGGVPGDVGTATVVSIMRAFNDLGAAAVGSGDVNHLNNFDLLAAGANLTWVAYNDTPFVSGVAINGYTTDATHFITLTVADASQVVSGNTQQHSGTAGTGVVIDSGGGPGGVIEIFEDFTRLHWFEVTGVKGVLPSGYVITVGAQEVEISHVLVHDFDDAANPTNDGISIADSGAADFYSLAVRNSIIYDGQDRCIQGDQADDTVTVENTTVYGCQSGIHQDLGSSLFISNTISMGNGLDFDVSGGGSFSNNMSEDGTAPGPASLINQIAADQFVNITAGDENNWDLHLIPTSTAISVGTPLGSVLDDIDRQARGTGAGWEMGADETRTVNYRSIGTAADYNAGSIDAFDGSFTVTGTGTSWQTANRGRGDRIDINGTDYTIFSVDSETELTLTTPVVGNFTGGYTISRQFDTLQEWEDCISGAGTSTACC